MARRSFLLRMDPELYAVLRRWAGDEMRSLNAQIEFVLRREATRAGRLRKDAPPAQPEDGSDEGT